MRPLSPFSRVALPIAMAMGVAACLNAESASGDTAQATDTTETSSSVATYEARGVIRAIDREASRVTIHHEDVPGYMPEMTMPFDLADAALVDGVSVGDSVTFTFHPESGGRHVITALSAATPD